MSPLSQATTIFTNIILVVIYAFALPHHFKTFFLPFKRVSIKSNSPGVNLEELREVVSYNLVSMAIGIFLRTFVIILGLLTLILAILVCLVVFIPLIIYLSFKKDPIQNKLTPFEEISKKTSLGKFIQAKIVLPPDELKSLISELNFKSWLEKNLLDEKDLERIYLWYQNLAEKGLVNLLDRDTITKISGIGADWSYGYTNNLNKFQVPQSSSPFPRVVGRDDQIEEIEKALAKTTQNSVIVAGEPGIGRHAVVDEFSRRLFAGKVNPQLVGYRTIYLDLKSAISAKYLALDLFEEGRQAGNIILVIDDIDKFFDLTDVFNQTLADGKLRVIGLTTQQMADKYVSQNSSVLKLFSLLHIEPPDIETVYQEMELSIVPVLEKNHKVEISYAAIKEAITSADRFITTIPFPEKAINILDETVSFIKSRHPHMTTLWTQDVHSYLSAKTKTLWATFREMKKKNCQI